MSEIINKKLHPYYKTGIYGWIGEEVDDNDYIICPICGDVLGMNYCDYAGEQGYDKQCPKCKQELDYSEIYDFEDTCYFEQLLEIKESKISDLEAKLAESKEQVEIVEKQHSELLMTIFDGHKENFELKQQLAEKDKAIENWQTMYESGVQTCHNDKEEIKKLKKQNDDYADSLTKVLNENADLVFKLAEKEKEIEIVKNMKANEMALKVIQKGNQDKISFAVEQINKLKNYLYDNEKINIRVCDFDEIDNIFDNQIKQLKEMPNEK